MTTEAIWTAARLLQWATEDFQSRGLDSPRRSAEILLSHALSTDRVGLYLQYDRPLSTPERESFRSLVERRRQGTPVAYLTKEREFYSLPLRVDQRVLIPRPETELLVDETLRVIQSHAWENPNLLDVGTGSGAIALALKKNVPHARVTATDVRSEALDVASENARVLGLDVTFIQSDLLSDVSGSFHLIAANLPYIRELELTELSPEVRNFEPVHALSAGEDGLTFIRRLIHSAKSHLSEGYLLLEIGVKQHEDVCGQLKDQGYRIEAVRNDLSGIPRVIVARQR